jgi:hypothetical protein
MKPTSKVSADGYRARTVGPVRCKVQLSNHHLTTTDSFEIRFLGILYKVLRILLHRLLLLYRRLSLHALSLFTVLFQYHEEHQYPIRGQILNPITCVEPSPGLSGNVMQMIRSASQNSGASLTSKWRCYTFPVSRVFIIRGDSQERDPRV